MRLLPFQTWLSSAVPSGMTCLFLIVSSIWLSCSSSQLFSSSEHSFNARACWRLYLFNDVAANNKFTVLHCHSWPQRSASQSRSSLPFFSHSDRLQLYSVYLTLVSVYLYCRCHCVSRRWAVNWGFAAGGFLHWWTVQRSTGSTSGHRRRWSRSASSSSRRCTILMWEQLIFQKLGCKRYTNIISNVRDPVYNQRPQIM